MNKFLENHLCPKCKNKMIEWHDPQKDTDWHCNNCGFDYGYDPDLAIKREEK